MPAPRSTTRIRTHPLGDAALFAELGTRLDTALNTRAIALAAALKKRRDVRQAIAGYASVTVHFDPDQISHDALTAAIQRLASKRPPIPVSVESLETTIKRWSPAGAWPAFSWASLSGLSEFS